MPDDIKKTPTEARDSIAAELKKIEPANNVLALRLTVTHEAAKSMVGDNGKPNQDAINKFYRELDKTLIMANTTPASKRINTMVQQLWKLRQNANEWGLEDQRPEKERNRVRELGRGKKLSQFEGLIAPGMLAHSGVTGGQHFGARPDEGNPSPGKAPPTPEGKDLV